VCATVLRAAREKLTDVAPHISLGLHCETAEIMTAYTRMVEEGGDADGEHVPARRIPPRGHDRPSARRRRLTRAVCGALGLSTERDEPRRHFTLNGGGARHALAATLEGGQSSRMP
jgi:hypothetical protein